MVILPGAPQLFSRIGGVFISGHCYTPRLVAELHVGLATVVMQLIDTLIITL
jgi:hypothetical protein